MPAHHSKGNSCVTVHAFSPWQGNKQDNIQYTIPCSLRSSQISTNPVSELLQDGDILACLEYSLLVLYSVQSSTMRPFYGIQRLYIKIYVEKRKGELLPGFEPGSREDPDKYIKIPDANLYTTRAMIRHSRPIFDLITQTPCSCS